MDMLLGNLDHLIQASPVLAFVVVFLAGVLVSFTPCVYPVIPLTLGFIGARSGNKRCRTKCTAFRRIGAKILQKACESGPF